MTGREAVLEATGETFAEVAERRHNAGPSDSAPQSASAEDDVAPDGDNEASERAGEENGGATCNEEARP